MMMTTPSAGYDGTEIFNFLGTSEGGIENTTTNLSGLPSVSI